MFDRTVASISQGTPEVYTSSDAVPPDADQLAARWRAWRGVPHHHRPPAQSERAARVGDDVALVCHARAVLRGSPGSAFLSADGWWRVHRRVRPLARVGERSRARVARGSVGGGCGCIDVAERQRILAGARRNRGPADDGRCGRDGRDRHRVAGTGRRALLVRAAGQSCWRRAAGDCRVRLAGAADRCARARSRRARWIACDDDGGPSDAGVRPAYRHAAARRRVSRIHLAGRGWRSAPELRANPRGWGVDGSRDGPAHRPRSRVGCGRHRHVSRQERRAVAICLLRARRHASARPLAGSLLLARARASRTSAPRSRIPRDRSARGPSGAFWPTPASPPASCAGR